MQVHHRFDVKSVGAHAVNKGEREAMEIELAIVSSNFPPALRFGHNPAQRAFKFVHKIPALAGSPLFIPKRCGFQFFVGFRMADDVHGAWRELPGRCRTPDGN